LPFTPFTCGAKRHLAAHQGTAAATEFQKILDHPGVVLNEPVGALAHLGLGRAYALEVLELVLSSAAGDVHNPGKNRRPKGEVCATLATNLSSLLGLSRSDSEKKGKSSRNCFVM
jgi:hypothetical protein